MEARQGESLLVYASAEVQIKTARAFVQSVLSYIPQDSPTVQNIGEQVEALQADDIEPEDAIRLAIFIFDYCLADEIRVQEGVLPHWTDDAAVYYRSDAFKAGTPVDLQPETNDIRYVFGHPEYTARFSNGLLTQNVGMVTFKGRFEEQYGPVTPCPRQILFAELIRCGINPITPHNEEVLKPVNEKASKEPLNQRLFRSKSRLALISSPEQRTSWVETTRLRWKNFILEQVGVGDVVLFGSGTSANEAVILALASMGRTHVYQHPFWYFENIDSVDISFTTVALEDISDAEVAFFNLDPTNHFNIGAPDSDPQVSAVIIDFIRGATIHTERSHVLVVDVTVNPFFSVQELISGEIPSNVVIVKTMSVTKHQQGDRRYFFGLVSVEGQDEDVVQAILREIEEKKNQVGGTLYDQHLVHFPRPKAGLETIQFAARERNLMLSGAHQQQERWWISPYTFHSFIFPPNWLIPRLLMKLRNGSGDDVLKWINDQIYDAVTQSVLGLDSSQLEFGDTFGLPVTRVSVQGGTSKVDGVSFRIKIPRICPGYLTEPQLVVKLANEITTRLDLVDFSLV